MKLLAKLFQRVRPEPPGTPPFDEHALANDETALGRENSWTKVSAQAMAAALDAQGRKAEAAALRQHYSVPPESGKTD